YDVGNGSGAILKEAGGGSFDDAFSYEITGRTSSISDSLVVAVLNSKGKGNGWDLEILEEKGTTGSHPRIYMSGSYPAVTKWTTTTKSEVQVIYTKYAGSFTNLSKTNSMIEQKADEINARVSNLEIGGKNMIPDTDFTLSASPPSSWSSWGSSSDAYINGSTINARLLLQTANPPSTTSNSAVGLVSPPLTQPLTKGKKYTLTWLANTSGSFTGFNYMFLLNTEDGNKMLTSADVERVETGLNAINTTATYSKYRITFESPVNGEANVLFGGLAEAGKYAYIYLTQPQLEKGELATSYNPANEDASERWSQLKITTDNITSEVGKKVGNDEIISRINQSSEKVSIDADKISLTAGSNLKLAVDNALRGGSAGVNLIGNTDFWIN